VRTPDSEEEDLAITQNIFSYQPIEMGQEARNNEKKGGLL